MHSTVLLMHLEEGPISLDILAYMDDAVDTAIEFWVLDQGTDGALLRLGVVGYSPGMKRFDVDISAVPGKSLDDLISESNDLDIVTATERS